MAGDRTGAGAVSPTSGVPQKRAFMGMTVNNERTKRRSTRACLVCRSRKVRCDVLSGGIPCTNCRLDSAECILTASCRGRKPSRPSAPASKVIDIPATTQEEIAPAQQATPPHNEQGHDYIMSLTFDEQSGSHSVDGIAEPENHEAQIGYGLQDDVHVDRHQLQHPLPPFEHVLPTSAANIFPSSGSRRSYGSIRQNSIRSDNVFSEHDSAGSTPPLPPYVKPLPSHLDQSDIRYLLEKDALTIPDDELRDELLRTYIKIVHVFMPAIDLDILLAPIMQPDGSTTISILLLQAVMFASVIFVDPSMLRSRGFKSRKSARKTFFKRVRLLYDLDCEPDRLILVQALLLMTYWYNSPEDEKDTWYWMGITLSLAQVLGLHRDPGTLRVSPREMGLRRRIWWSCYIRDRLLALGIRRPARIRAEEFDVQTLSFDDYSAAQLTLEQTAFIKEFAPSTTNGDRMKAFCQICIDLAKLCVCVGHILHSQYSVISSQAYESENCKNIAVLPKKSGQQLVELGQCDAELEQWQREQKAADDQTESSPTLSATVSANCDDINADRIVWLHRALLRMIYLTAVGALHRPHALTSSRGTAGAPEPAHAISREDSLRKVKEAATALSTLAFDLQAGHLLRYQPTSSIPAFLSASLIHLLDVRHTQEDVRNLAIGRVYQCFHVLVEMQDMYSSADYAIRFLGSVLRRMNINLPMLATFQASATMNEADGLRPLIAANHTQCAQSTPSNAGDSHAAGSGSGGTGRNVAEAGFVSPNLGIINNFAGPDLALDATMQSMGNAFHDDTFGAHTWEGLLPALIDFEADPMLCA